MAVTQEQYLLDPCGSSSLPYWKSLCVDIPDGMLVIHDRVFSGELLREYRDEPYFRLKHDLAAVKRNEHKAGFMLMSATAKEFADHINLCYDNIRVTEAEVAEWQLREVYCDRLWVVLRDKESGEIVASGIGELDRTVGEGVLEWIQVSPGYRGMGLGQIIVSALLCRMEGHACFVTVSGRMCDPCCPERLYRRCGFSGEDIWHILRR